MNENSARISSLREWIGSHHYMSQLYRSYDFPMTVYRENEDGSRALVRVENPSS